VATLHPNHSWEKVVFDPWRQKNWDVNDTVLIADPKVDPDVGPGVDPGMDRASQRMNRVMRASWTVC